MGLLTMFQYANTHTDNLFTILLLVSLYLVIMVSIIMKRGEEAANSAFIMAGLVTALTSVFLLMAQLITMNIFVICVIVFAISIGISYWTRNKD